MDHVTVAASVMIDLVAQLEAKGIRALTLCDRAGVAAAFLERPHDRITGREAQRLWDAAVQLADDPLLGLHLTERYHVGALNILGYVLLNCRDAREALERLCRFAALLNDGLAVRTTESGDRLTVHLAPVAGPDNFLEHDGRQVMETMAAGIVLTLGRLTERSLVPLEVAFRHKAAGPLTEYHRILGTLVRFGEGEDRVTFRRDDLVAPIRSADPSLLPVFEAHAQARLIELEGAGVTGKRVLRAISARLAGTSPDIGIVARELAMSSRALQRALQAEGATFQGLLDEARKRIAFRELRLPGATAAEVALLLGYSEASAFTRAFRRWTGTTPSAWTAAGSSDAGHE